MLASKRVLVTGAGGFIGHHLTKYLVNRGYWVRGVDIKEPEYEPTAAQEFMLLDLRRWENCAEATRGIDEVYALAANMGGIGFIAKPRFGAKPGVRVSRTSSGRNNNLTETYFNTFCAYPLL